MIKLSPITAFYPEVQCIECPRLTHIAVYDPEMQAYFSPRCPLHGFVYERYGKDAHEQSVKRYVLWAHDSMGEVSHIKHKEDALHYILWDVVYIYPDGTQELCIVRWHHYTLQFSIRVRPNAWGKAGHWKDRVQVFEERAVKSHTEEEEYV